MGVAVAAAVLVAAGGAVVLRVVADERGTWAATPVGGSWQAAGGPVTTVRVDVVDAAAPDSAASFTVDAAELLEPGETLANDRRTVGVFLVGGVPVVLAPDGEGLYLAVFGERMSGPEALLVACPVRVDLALSGPILHLILHGPDTICVSLPDVRSLITENVRVAATGGAGSGRRA